MTANEIMTVVGFFVMLLTTIAGVWWRIEGRISTASDKAQSVKDELAAHRLHVAETYVTKAGMQEQTAQIMDAISGVKAAVEHVTVRIDRIVEVQPARRSTRQG